MTINHFYSYFCAIKKIKGRGGKYEKDGWVINNDLFLYNFGLYFLPIIKEINGSFYCAFNQLTTLKGAPQKVDGSFYCHQNQLTSLEYVPQEINGTLYCNYNNIKDYSMLEKIKVKWAIHK